MNLTTENPTYRYEINTDLNQIDWDYMVTLYEKINWRTRIAEELKNAFEKSLHTIFIYKGDRLIAFGRAIGDGRYYAILADIVVDPDFQGEGLGKYLITKLNSKLEDYHFVNLSAAPGADRFYKKLGWKKQITAYIWPQGPKQLRQHCEPETH